MSQASQVLKEDGVRGPASNSLLSVKICALAAWLTGLALVIQGLLTLLKGAPQTNQPPLAGVILALGLLWGGMGFLLFKTPKLTLISLMAFLSLVFFLFSILFGSLKVWGGSLGRFTVMIWSLLLNLVSVIAFVQKGSRTERREGALPAATGWRVGHLAVSAQVVVLRNTMSIAWREVKRYFRSPSSYIILALFLLYQGLIFYIVVRYLNDPRAPHGAPMKFFFGGPFWFWPLECFIIAIITMDTLAEEQIRRTIEPLMTAPVHEVELVLGKFLGALGFFIFLWIWTFLYVIMMVCHVQTVRVEPVLVLGLLGGFGAMWALLLVSTRKAGISGIIAWAFSLVGGLIVASKSEVPMVSVLKLMGIAAIPVAAVSVRSFISMKNQVLRIITVVVTAAGLLLAVWYGYGILKVIFKQAGPNAPNMGPILAGYFGALLIGAAGIALGILFSSLTRDLKLACMLTFVTLFLLIIVKIMLMPDVNIIDTRWVRDLMEHLNFFDYMRDFAMGFLDTRQITLLLSVIVVCLFGAARAVQSFKWR